MPPPDYVVILHEDTLDKLTEYKEKLTKNRILPGAYLRRRTRDVNLEKVSTEYFLTLLLQTKKPCIFAESEAFINGSDWTKEEFSILGDVAIGVEVDVFDNGAWSRLENNFRIHDPSFQAHLLFLPAPLLAISHSPDYEEIVDSGKRINEKKYAAVLRRRLLPLFHYIQSQSSDENKAIVTIPGLGCGAFAGDFSEILPGLLRTTIHEILEENCGKLLNIDCIVYVPFDGETIDSHIGHISFRTRPYRKHLLTQLSKPVELQEKNDDFSKHKLFKIVAWDHVSYPGNDYFRNSRNTDDGVAAAATNCMAKILGIEGINSRDANYKPPSGYRNWEDVANKNHIPLRVEGNLRVFINFP